MMLYINNKRYPVQPIFFLLFFALAIGKVVSAHAQQEITDTVEETIVTGVSEYKPLGIHAGSFYIFPVAEIGVKQDSNILRLPDELEISDTIYFANLSAAVNSDWNRHNLNALVLAKLGYYNEYDSENYKRFTATANGQYDVLQDSFATGRVGISRWDKGRSSLDDRGTREPTVYDTSYVTIGYNHSPSRLQSNIKLDYRRINFQNNTSITGENIDNSDRDRSTPVATIRMGYENLPERSLFIEASINAVIYDQEFDNNGIERSSTGYKITTGINYNLTSLLVGDIFVGYLIQDYDDVAADDLREPVFGFGLEWTPTRLTTVHLDLDRKPRETTSPTAIGYLNTRFTISVEHELLRNIILTGDFTYSENKYNEITTDSKQEEEYVFAGIGAQYLFSRRYFATASYQYGMRNSNIETDDYKVNQAILSLGANW